MDTEFDNDDYEDDDVNPEASDDETPRGLRKAAADGKRARAEAAALRKEVALLKAGVDLDSPLGAMFAKAYEGDLEPAAVKAAWTALGVTPTSDVTDDPAPETPDPEFTPEELASTSQRQALANGSPADTPADAPDPRTAALALAADVVASGGTQDDAMAAGLEHLIAAAAAGDQRVIIPRNG